MLFRLGQFSMRFSIENIDNSAFKLSFNEKVWRYFNEFLLRISIMSSSAKEIDLPSSKCFRDGHLVTNFLKRISCLLNSLYNTESHQYVLTLHNLCCIGWSASVCADCEMSGWAPPQAVQLFGAVLDLYLLQRAHVQLEQNHIDWTQVFLTINL